MQKNTPEASGHGLCFMVRTWPTRRFSSPTILLLVNVFVACLCTLHAHPLSKSDSPRGTTGCLPVACPADLTSASLLCVIGDHCATPAVRDRHSKAVLQRVQWIYMSGNKAHVSGEGCLHLTTSSLNYQSEYR